MQTDAMKICWKLRIPGCRRADPKQLRQPAGAGEHDGALSIRALGSTHYTARSTGFESYSPNSRNHVFQDNGLKSPSQSNNQQQNKKAKPVDKKTVDTLPDNGWLKQLLYSYCNPLYGALSSVRWTPTFWRKMKQPLPSRCHRHISPSLKETNQEKKCKFLMAWKPYTL